MGHTIPRMKHFPAIPQTVAFSRVIVELQLHGGGGGQHFNRCALIVHADMGIDAQGQSYVTMAGECLGRHAIDSLFLCLVRNHRRSHQADVAGGITHDLLGVQDQRQVSERLVYFSEDQQIAV